MKREFKVGDRVKIIKKGSHGFDIGDILTIKQIYYEGTKHEHYKAENIKEKFWYVNKDEIELISKALTITISDKITTLTDGTHTTSINRYYTDKHDEELAVNLVVKKYYDELRKIEEENKLPKVGDMARVIDSGKLYPRFDEWLINNNVPLKSAIKWVDNHRFGDKIDKMYEVIAIHSRDKYDDTKLVLIEGDDCAFIIGIDGLEKVENRYVDK